MIDEAQSVSALIQKLFSTRIIDRQKIWGGDINEASLLILENGQQAFLKENRMPLLPMFVAEAQGIRFLSALREHYETPSVPTVLAWGKENNRAFLLLSAILPGQLSSGEEFGRSLALLHRQGRNKTCGFPFDNWIGSSPQPNKELPTWAEFFAERRLAFQWEMARQAGYGDAQTGTLMRKILSKLNSILPDLEQGGASLLHGDLWGGNWMAGADGRAWLIDPAPYYGHREADLAMSELFGGFPAGFREGYQDAWPLEAGYKDRRNLYNLYHLLNHLNLFGDSYWNRVKKILHQYA